MQESTTQTASTVIIMESLLSQRLDVKKKLLNKNNSDETIVAIHLEAKKLLTQFERMAKAEYEKFKLFCCKHKALFDSGKLSFDCVFSNSHDLRNPYRITYVRLHPSRNALRIGILNTFDNCNDKSVVLVPYEFIDSPDAYLVTRVNYIKNHHLKKIRNRIISTDETIAKLKVQKEKDTLDLNNFNSHFEKHFNY